MIPMADLRLQVLGLKSEIRAALDALVEEQAFVLGPRVAAFETALAEFLSVRHAVGVKSGSDALLLSLLALGIGPGDEVVTTPFSFFATAGAIRRAGATPVFADVRADSLALDPRAVRSVLGPRTKAIIVVHLFGQPAELGELCALADEWGIALVEDSAQALGATYRDRQVGTMGRLGCYSFHPSKPLGAFGDAGAVVTNDRELAARVQKLRTHGGLRRNEHDLPFGGNHRLDALQAAILSVKLPRLSGWIDTRRAHARAYDEALQNVSGLAIPPRIPGTESSYSAYTLRVANGLRDSLVRHLRAAGVESAVYYPKPLHLQQALADSARSPAPLPVAERAAGEVLSIPIYPELSREARERVAASVRDFFEGASVKASFAGAPP
jgi:dTDP-4-amino-4,6-dideoxygalactose transaminase